MFRPLIITVFAASAGILSSRAAPVDFNESVRPILTGKCTACHGGVKQAGGVSFVYEAKALGKGKSGEPTIVPGNPGGSELLRRAVTDDPDEKMPPPDHEGEALTEAEVATLRQWISEGARWGGHWSFQKPVAAPAPVVEQADWPARDLDRFVLARLESEGIAPSPAADPAQWLRRASFALVGLPPSKAELDEFRAAAANDYPAAKAAAVERLLASERFGERWAAVWLDLARYADSMGYEKDLARTIWPWRDWVIRAFNADMPYDQFTVRQLAGDLLPEATLDDRVATGFHRNSQTNVEGGSDDEEFRIASLVDRVSATWTVWQGMTFGCVQCHSHPYDPIPHHEFYEFAAFFNNVADCDLKDDYPRIKVPADPAEAEKAARWQAESEAVSAAIMEPFQNGAAKVAWQPAAYEHVWDNKEQVELAVEEQGGRQAIVAKGTPAQKSIYEVVVKSPAARVAAVRVESLMKPGDSAHTPSDAFVVTEFELRIRRAGNHEPGKDFEKVPVAFVALDEANGYFWTPQWGAFPNQFHDRYAVVIPKDPVALGEGDRLSVVMHQNYGRDGAAPPVLRRFAISIDDSDGWAALLANPGHAAGLKRRGEIEGALKKMKGAMTPVLAERAAFPRQTAVFRRGNFLDKTDAVAPGLPEVLGGAKGGDLDRLAMAKWIGSAENPLTARVFANRVWAQFFGIGIVETLEDFGSTGTPPSHPALLDHLAARFQSEMGWSVKALVREIALSATFGQDAAAAPAAVARDPRNRLLARGPRVRLSAEMVRDAALTASGQLSAKMYGPPVMPPQPDGIWKIARSGEKWKAAQGEDRYRRALYTYWRRSAPYPSFQTFDAPERKVCSPRRIATNTPLQALVTLNDPVYLEAAQAFAGRMKREGGGDAKAWIAFGIESATSREPDPQDIATFAQLYADAQAELANDAAAAKQLGDDPALTIVANTLLNLDAALTR
ncbi:MAG: PSD1 and planctomycete cytochrome C domain-containing protein [Verrucomicrobiales bacterium]